MNDIVGMLLMIIILCLNAFRDNRQSTPENKFDSLSKKVWIFGTIGLWFCVLI